MRVNFVRNRKRDKTGEVSCSNTRSRCMLLQVSQVLPDLAVHMQLLHVTLFTHLVFSNLIKLRLIILKFARRGGHSLALNYFRYVNISLDLRIFR